MAKRRSKAVRHKWSSSLSWENEIHCLNFDNLHGQVVPKV